MELTQEQKNWLDECTEGSWSLNKKGLVDIDGSFNCKKQNLKDFKGVKFGKVSGNFDCSHNKLTSLVGAPQKVGGSFHCYNNKLTSLEGAPQEVGGGFYCDNNKLTSLEGAPQKVKGWFSCSYNKLTSLEGAPQEVGEDFYCSGNQLTSLVGAPQVVRGRFDCRHNQLTSLVGAPQEVGGSFDCTYNKLTSLEGAPQEVGTWFECSYNPIRKRTLELIYEKMRDDKVPYIIALSVARLDIKNRIEKLIKREEEELRKISEGYTEGDLNAASIMSRFVQKSFF